MFVFVHGVPETFVIWDEVRANLDVASVALSMPGFGCDRPDGCGRHGSAGAGYGRAGVTRRPRVAFALPVKMSIYDVPRHFRHALPARIATG